MQKQMILTSERHSEHPLAGQNTQPTLHKPLLADLNGMLQHSLGGGVVFVSLEHFISPFLDYMPCLPSRQKREAIRAFNPRREQ